MKTTKIIYTEHCGMVSIKDWKNIATMDELRVNIKRYCGEEKVEEIFFNYIDLDKNQINETNFCAIDQQAISIECRHEHLTKACILHRGDVIAKEYFETLIDQMNKASARWTKIIAKNKLETKEIKI